MSVIVYKDGKKELVEPEHLNACLEGDYFITREESIGEVKEPAKPKAKAKKATK